MIRDNTDAAAQKADNEASDNVRIEIYGGNGCNYCTKAKALCEEKDRRYVYRNIDEDPEYFDQLMGRIGRWKTIPQIFIGAEHVGGYTELQQRLAEG